MARWGEFAAHAPDLAAFGAERLAASPAYLATIRNDGAPRVHPVSPIIGAGSLFVFMEPASPKGHDLRTRMWYALHNGVPDMYGSGGEFFISGRASLVNEPHTRAVACEAAAYQPEERYILFELEVSEARCNGYGDMQLPDPQRWTVQQG